MTFTGILKIRLPDDDSLPYLTAEEVDRLPPALSSELSKLGQHECRRYHNDDFSFEATQQTHGTFCKMVDTYKFSVAFRVQNSADALKAG